MQQNSAALAFKGATKSAELCSAALFEGWGF